MFIPRTDADACSSTGVSCSNPSSPPNDEDASSAVDPSSMKSGAQRYIGIGMVLGLFLIIFLAWLYLGKWPRRILHQHCCCCSRRSKQFPKSIDDDREDGVSSRSSEKETILENSNKRLTDSEMTGSMVVFTQVPKALSGKDRYPAEWEMEHVHGIRLETRTPQRHHTRNGSRKS